MSECGLFRRTKLTLCGLVVAIASIMHSSCSIVPSQRVPSYKAEQRQNEVLKEALNYIRKSEYAKVQGLLEQRTGYLHAEHQRRQEELRKTNPGASLPVPDLTPSERTLLAIACANNRDYNSAETHFRTIMSAFKQKPAIVEEVRTDLSEYLASNEYTKSESQLAAAAFWIPRLYSIMGFLHMTKENYEKSANYFRAAVPKFEENTVNEYREAFSKLAILAYHKGEKSKTLGYAAILAAVHDAEPATSDNPKELTQEEKHRHSLARLLNYAAKDKNEKLMLEIIKELAETYNPQP